MVYIWVVCDKSKFELVKLQEELNRNISTLKLNKKADVQGQIQKQIQDLKIRIDHASWSSEKTIQVAASNGLYIWDQFNPNLIHMCDDLPVGIRYLTGDIDEEIKPNEIMHYASELEIHIKLLCPDIADLDEIFGLGKYKKFARVVEGIKWLRFWATHGFSIRSSY